MFRIDDVRPGMSVFVVQMEDPVLEKWNQYEEERADSCQDVGIVGG